jgi:hypothetical protein
VLALLLQPLLLLALHLSALGPGGVAQSGNEQVVVGAWIDFVLDGRAVTHAHHGNCCRCVLWATQLPQIWN